MRVTQRLDHALRALVEMARLNTGERLAVSELSDRLRLPKRSLEQRVTELARMGLVECRRGPGGGCRLSAQPDNITVAAVARDIEGEVLETHAGTDSAVSCMWSDLARVIEGALQDTSIADLARKQSWMESDSNPMYFI